MTAGSVHSQLLEERDSKLSTNDMNYVCSFPNTFTAYPIAALPMSYLDFNGRPFGLIIAAPRNKETIFIKVMSAWEATFPARQEPSESLKHSSVAQEL